jgi:hypothetical protein
MKTEISTPRNENMRTVMVDGATIPLMLPLIFTAVVVVTTVATTVAGTIRGGVMACTDPTIAGDMDIPTGALVSVMVFITHGIVAITEDIIMDTGLITMVTTEMLTPPTITAEEETQITPPEDRATIAIVPAFQTEAPIRDLNSLEDLVEPLLRTAVSETEVRYEIHDPTVVLIAVIDLQYEIHDPTVQ